MTNTLTPDPSPNGKGERDLNPPLPSGEGLGVRELKRNPPLKPYLKAFARENRTMLTRGEEIFWACVRNRRLNALKFKRQTPLGGYIVDFYCFDYALIVEIDGAGHDFAKDALRDTWFKQNGYNILHLNDELVIGSPELAVQEVIKFITTLTPNPSPKGEGKAA